MRVVAAPTVFLEIDKRRAIALIRIPAALLRLAGAVLIESHDEWHPGGFPSPVPGLIRGRGSCVSPPVQIVPRAGHSPGLLPAGPARPPMATGLVDRERCPR